MKLTICVLPCCEDLTFPKKKAQSGDQNEYFQDDNIGPYFGVALSTIRFR
jgi:hypothetical protein